VHHRIVYPDNAPYDADEPVIRVVLRARFAATALAPPHPMARSSAPPHSRLMDAI